MENTSLLTAKLSIQEKFALRLLEKMTLGSLTLELPSGLQLYYGDGSSNICADLRIKNADFFKKVLLYGDIGFGEAYVDGDFETSSITNLVSWVILNIENAPTLSGSKLRNAGINILKLFNRLSHLGRANTQHGSARNIAYHYDLSNDFYALWLDRSMTYSSAYFTNENTCLKEAQYAKYEMLCRSMNLQAGDQVLEIGCGWGGFAVFMAKNYKVKVKGVTISKEQYAYALDRIKRAGLENEIEIALLDYRKITGKYDKVVSIEMIEAVGHSYYKSFFSKINEVLKKDGIFAMQAITIPDSRYKQMKNSVDWIQKHIFPGGLLPSVAIINKNINKTGDLTLLGLKEMGMHYARTLEKWRSNFNHEKNALDKLGYDTYFNRKWNYYLCYCEAAFKMRNINVVQMVYSRPNNTKIRM